MIGIVHDNAQIPLIDTNGIGLAPGRKHKLNYKKKTNFFLPSPYTSCTNNIPLSMKVMFKDYNGADYSYSQLSCYELCIQAYAYEQCGCTNPYLWNIRYIVLPGTQNIILAPLCYYEVSSLAMWDVIVNHIIPTTIIIFCSLLLLLRVLYQKFQMHRPIRWQNHRKMTIQVLSISVLYLVVYFPKMLLEFIHLCGIPEEVGADLMHYADFFVYYGNLFLPFVCAGSMPELKEKIKKLFLNYRRRTQVIGPQTLALSPNAGDPQFKF
ncbi:unnamed protein product [Rotaria sp. Silwood1]|nr:unnamed protein product [Rotaria sp. Silwood1]